MNEYGISIHDSSAKRNGCFDSRGYAEAWDVQKEANAQAGKLDTLAAEARVEYKAGEAKEI